MPETPITFEEAVAHAISQDPRYRHEAYEFVREALHVAAKVFRGEGSDQHVSGQELLEGVRVHALKQYGPMALLLLRMWGIERGEDVGSIVYNLIGSGYFGKNEGDSIEDFAGGYDFAEAFSRPFQPSSPAV